MTEIDTAHDSLGTTSKDPDATHRQQHGVLAARRQFEGRFQALAREMFDVSYEWNPDATGASFEEVLTSALARVVGYAQHTRSRRDDWTSMIHPDDRAIAEAHRQRVLRGQRDVCVFRVILPGGDVRWVGKLTRPVVDEASRRVVYVFGLIQVFSAQEPVTSWSDAENDFFLTRLAA